MAEQKFSKGYIAQAHVNKNIESRTLVYITNGSNSVIGNLVSKFVLDVESKWQPNALPEQASKISTIDLKGLTFSLDDVGTLSNTNILNSGILSRKVYKGGSYLKTTIVVRVMDTNDEDIKKNGRRVDVRESIRQMASMMAPAPVSEQIQTFAKTLIPYAKQKTIGALDAGWEGLKSMFGASDDAVLKSVQEYGEKLRNVGAEGSMKSALLVVGNYFMGEVVLNSVTSKYSKEWTDTGPLYVDFTITAQTRKILDRTEIDGTLKLNKNANAFVTELQKSSTPSQKPKK